MNKQSKPKTRKAWKIVSLIMAPILILCVLAIPTLLILDTTQVISLTSGVNRQYTMTFVVENKVVEELTYFRGQEIDYSVVKTPTKNGNSFKYYSFIGWDINGDNFTDILPSKAYSSFKAVAVFREYRTNGN